jgi:hydrogenase nickel incorporation protein HypA/HybF
VHELALCRSVVAAARRHAEGRPVTQVALRVGHLRQVVPEAMDLAWTALTDGTELEGATLVVEAVPAVVHCRDCGADTELEWPVLACGACGGRGVDLVSGEELLVASIDVRDGAA